MIENLKVIARGGRKIGRTTGNEKCCNLEGCTGRRLHVRWKDGKFTWPCTKGMLWNDAEQSWKII